MIRSGVETGAFDDWPLDLSPDVLAYQEWSSAFVDIETPEGRAILDAAS
jgi:hypothetical protein